MSLSDSLLKDGLVERQQQMYITFLLRIWKDPETEGQWKFSLEDTQTGDRVGFVSLGRLADYLAQWIKNATDKTDQPGSSN